MTKRKKIDSMAAIRLSQRISPMLAGHDAATQGGALADLVSIFIAGHHPCEREKQLEVFIDAVKSLIPISELQVFPDGLPSHWKAQ